jgi:hypothetical protein
MFTDLLLLTKVQLQNNIDAKFFSSKRKVISKIIFTVVFLVVLSYLLSMLFSYFKLLTSIAMSENILIFIISLMVILSTVTCSIGMNKALYYATDGQTLMSLPTTPVLVYFSKLLFYYIFELKRNLLFYFGFFFGYGLHTGKPLNYYLYSLLVYVFLNLLPVCLGAFIGTIGMFIGRFISSTYLFKIFLALGIFVGFYVALLYFTKYIPTEFRLVGRWSDIYKGLMSLLNTVAAGNPLGYVNSIINGTNVYNGLKTMLMLTILPLIISTLFVKTIYFKLVATPLEIAKKQYKVRKSRLNVKGSFFYFMKKELIVLFRSPTNLIKEYTFILIAPIIIVYFNEIIAALPLKPDGIKLVVVFNFVILLTIFIASNINCSNVLNKESQTLYYLKTLPVSKSSYLLAKIFINLLVDIIGLVICTRIIFVYSKISNYQYLILLFCSFFFIIGHLLYTYGRQIRFIKLDSVDSQSGEDNVATVSILLGMITTIYLSVIMCLNILEKNQSANNRTLFVCFIYFVYNLVIYIVISKTYFSQIGVEQRGA